MCHCVVTLVCGVVSFTRLPEISTRIARGKLIEFLPPPGFTLGLGGVRSAERARLDRVGGSRWGWVL